MHEGSNRRRQHMHEGSNGRRLNMHEGSNGRRQHMHEGSNGRLLNMTEGSHRGDRCQGAVKARREMWETEDDISYYPGLQRRAVPPEMS